MPQRQFSDDAAHIFCHDFGAEHCSKLIVIQSSFHCMPSFKNNHSIHLSAEEIRCVCDDNSKIIFCQIFIKTYVVGAH